MRSDIKITWHSKLSRESSNAAKLAIHLPTKFRACFEFIARTNGGDPDMMLIPVHGDRLATVKAQVIDR